MSKEIFSTKNEYLKLAYSKKYTVQRPGNTFFTQYDYPLELQSSGYTPMILGYYRVDGGNRYPCFTTFVSAAAQPEGALATTFASPGTLSIGAVGSPSNPTTYNLEVEVFVLINSLTEVA